MDGSVGNELPWASVFDSTANMRALTAIQAEGFRAASKLVDRFIVAAADGLNAPGGTARARTERSDDRRADLWGATDVEPLLKSWWAMVGQLSRGFVPSGAESDLGADGAPTLEFADSTASGRLAVETTPGSTVTAAIWLNNLGTHDHGDIRLRVGELQSDRGHILASHEVSLNPAAVPMPGRSGRGIDLRIGLGDDVLPGLYRGNLLTEGHPDLWLPIAITVRGRAG